MHFALRTSHSSRLWLAILALICAAEILSHAGARAPFLESGRPVHGGNEHLQAEGYVSWIGIIPVQRDSVGLMTLVSLFLGERGPENSGILDRRAGYAYLVSLAVPSLTGYGGFLFVNWLFWWGASAATYWFVRHRWHDPRLALATSLLVAAGNGFLFMAGTPMSYLAAYAYVIAAWALAEWLDAFERPRLGAWLLLGWAAGVASTIYFAHLPLLISWWLYGARRVPWRFLAAATAVVLAISTGWELWGRWLAGLAFITDNSGALGDSVRFWLNHAREPLALMVTYLRAATVARTLLGAFPWPWWILAGIGLLASTRQDREWAMAVFMSGLIPAIVLLSLLPVPRAAFYMYPAIYLLAARGALTLGGAVRHAFAGRTATLGAPRIALAPTLSAVSAVLALAVLVYFANADLLGQYDYVTAFHFAVGYGA